MDGGVPISISQWLLIWEKRMRVVRDGLSQIEAQKELFELFSKGSIQKGSKLRL